MPRSLFNIILFGETGVGKSSIINLIAGKPIAETSPHVHGCTMSFKPYTFPLQGQEITIWDTVGLEEPEISARGYLPAIEQSFELIQHVTDQGGIDLLLFCFRGNRPTATMQSNYRLFYEVLCHSQVPIAFVITHLEGESDMDRWWKRSKDPLKKYGLKCAAHACVTGLPMHPKYRESQRNVLELLSRFGSQTPFIMPPEMWFIEFLRLFGLFAPLPQGAKQKDVLKVLVRRCRIDQKFAESVAQMLQGQGSTLGEPEINQQGDIPNLTEHVRRTTPHSVSGNTLQYTWKEGHIHRNVAVKFVIGLNTHKKYRVDLKLRASLRNKAIVPLLGVVDDPIPGIVTQWFSTGSLSDYLHRNPSLPLDDKRDKLGDVAVGLCYRWSTSNYRACLNNYCRPFPTVHSQNVVHGNLHSNNILVNNDGTCCLTDLSFTLPDKFTGVSWLRNLNYESLRFADPRLAMHARTAPDEVISPNKYCDIFSFGGVILHVLFGTRPYGDLGWLDILKKLLDEERPMIPSQPEIPPGYESLITKCWDSDDSKRPSAEAFIGGHWFTYR